MQMSHWKAKLEQAWPGMKVIGELADQPGYLLKITCDAMDTHQLGQLQEALLELGCTGWNWKHEHRCMTVRAYAPRQSALKIALRRAGAASVAITLAALYIYTYDIRVAEIVGL